MLKIEMNERWMTTAKAVLDPGSIRLQMEVFGARRQVKKNSQSYWKSVKQKKPIQVGSSGDGFIQNDY